MCDVADVNLGKVLSHRPSGVEGLRLSQVIDLVTAVAQSHPDAFDIIKQQVNHRRGRPRRLSVEVVLAAAIATGLTGRLHVSKVRATLITDLDVGDQRRYGVRWTDPNRRGEQRITTRQVEYLVDCINRALFPAEHKHNHLLVAPGDLVYDGRDPDRPMFVAHLEDLNGDERPSLDCTSDCPAYWTAERIINTIITAIREHLGIPRSGKYALDSYLLETHFKNLSWASMSDYPTKNLINHAGNTVSGPPTSKGGGKKPGGGSAASVKQKEAIDAALTQVWRERLGLTEPTSSPSSVDPKSRAISPIGPTVRGRFSTDSTKFPQLRPDGRPANTQDHGAGTGFKGAGSNTKTRTASGRDVHVIVDCGHLNDQPVPGLIVSYASVPAGEKRDRATLAAVDYAAQSPLGDDPALMLDMGYTLYRPSDIEIPMRDRGIRIVKDLRADQRDVLVQQTGVWNVDGNFFTSGIPQPLIDLPKQHRSMSSAERAALQARYDAREPFRFRSRGRTAAGSLRYFGPAVPDSAPTRNKFGRATKVRGVKVACVNSEFFHLVKDSKPHTNCVLGEECGCSATFALPADQLPQNYQVLLFGGADWAKEYGRRNLVESLNAVEQYHVGVDRHSIFVRGQKADLIQGLIHIATLLTQIHGWMVRLGAWALDLSVVSTLTSRVVRACLAQIGVQSAPSQPQAP